MADVIDVKSLQNIQTGNYSAPIVDFVGIEVAGVFLSGVAKNFDFPIPERETFEIEAQVGSTVVSNIIKPVNFQFEINFSIPELTAIVVRAPALNFRSMKSRMAILQSDSRYEEAVSLIGQFVREERQTQAYKTVDTVKMFLTLVTFQMKWGNGVNCYEQYYYRASEECRIHGLQIAGGTSNATLINC